MFLGAELGTLLPQTVPFCLPRGEEKCNSIGEVQKGAMGYHGQHSFAHFYLLEREFVLDVQEMTFIHHGWHP